MSRHAVVRCQQGGVTMTLLDKLQEVADRSVPVGAGCYALSLSRRQAHRLRKLGHTPPATLERLDGLTLVESSTGVVVTVLHASTRRYRRAWK